MAQRRIAALFCLLIGILLVAFTGYKAAYISFTHDESLTWLDIYHSVHDIIVGNPPSSNNHMLNTLLMRSENMSIGQTEFDLRLHTWISHFIYIIFSFQIARLFKNTFLMAACFVLLNCNPYLLDFFSLARGYGMALAFMMGSLYFALIYVRQQKIWKVSLALFFGMIAVLANFTWLNYYIVLIGVLGIYQLSQVMSHKNTGVKSWLQFLPYMISLVLMYLVLKRPITGLQAGNNFFFGGEKGFWQDTVFNLVKDLLYLKNMEWLAWPLFVLVILFLFIALDYLVVLVYKKGFLKESAFFYFAMGLLFFAGLSTVVQHGLIGTKFLLDRTSLLFFPLFMLVVVLFANELMQNKKWKLASVSLISGLGLLMIGYTCFAVNFHSVREWQYDSDTKAMLKVLDKEVPLMGRKTEGVFLQAHWFFEPTINFYRRTTHMEWVRHIDRYEKSDTSKYEYVYLIDVNDNDRAEYKRERKRIIVEYPEIKTALVKWRR